MSNFVGKKILILGGNQYLIDVVYEARKKGLVLYVIDNNPNSPCKCFADKAYDISVTEVDKIVQLCKEENIDGIITGFVDMILPFYADICKKAGLPCYGTLETFINTTDKKRFKEKCRENETPSTIEYSINEIQQDDSLFPVIVKPVDSSSSRGISVCYEKEQINKAIEYALSFSESKEYILEKFMTGQEVVMYYYFQDKQPTFIGMCDRYTGKSDEKQSKVPTAYIFPSQNTQSHIDNSDIIYKRMFKKMGIENGSMFLQCFVENGIPYVYEPGYRLNGAREYNIYGDILDINSVDMLIHFAMTGSMADFSIEEKSDPFIQGKVACKLSPILGLGKVARIEGVEDALDLPQVKKIILTNEVGAEITQDKIGTLPSLAYRAYIVCDNYEELKKIIEIVHNLIKYYDTSGSLMEMEKFDVSVLDSYQ